MAEKYFFLEESPYYANKVLIRMDHEKFRFPNGTNGSYAVFPARLLNLSYASYLRYARDQLGAELIGKNTKYVIAYFEKTPEVKMLVRLLNARMAYILNEKEFPYDYKEEEGKVVRTPFEENVSNTGIDGKV